MTQVQESGSRTRTRQAIVDAAIETLGRNPAATLGDIAAAAGVGRTTLHRYFPERADLLSAVSAAGADCLERATGQARLAEGTGASAIRRLVQEYFDLGELLSLMFSDASAINTAEWTAACGFDDSFTQAVERGHRDGTVDPELPAAWVQNLIWSQLYSGWSYRTETGTSRHEVLRLILRTVDGAIAAQPAGSR